MAERGPRRGPVAVAEGLRPDMRSRDEELQVRSKALRAAKRKANVEARAAREEDRRLRQEEYKLLRVYPAKSFVAKYFLKERSGGMICRDEWYRYHVPEEEDDHEVTLQLWRKPSKGTPALVGEVGDLYSLSLELPMEITMDLNILVESAEAKKDHQLRIQFSVMDLGHCDKAYSVSLEAWQNYLIFRDETNKMEMDCRLLYHAICNRWEVGDLTLEAFSKLRSSDIFIMMQRMEVGGDYPRPSVAEASLATEPPAPEPTPEMLRTQEEEDAELQLQVSNNLDLVIRRRFGRRPSFAEIVEYEDMVAKNLGYSPRKLKRKRLNPYPRREAFRLHPDVERQKNIRLNKFLENVIDPEKKFSPDDPKVELKVSDLDDPVGTMKFVDSKLPPPSPSTLKSWSGSGWETNDDEGDKAESTDDDDDIMVIKPLDALGRIIQEDAPPPSPGVGARPKLKLKPEVDWETSIKAAEEARKAMETNSDGSLNETVLSLVSSLSGIEVLDRSSELESNPREATTSSDDARNRDDDSNSTFNDSVEVFLAKKTREEDIVTLSTGSSSSDSSGITPPEEDPDDGATRTSPGSEPKRGPGQITFQGRRFNWMVPAQVAEYPGGFIDDLVYMGIPRELWPYPVDGEDQVNPPDAGCGSHKPDDEKI